MIPKIIHWCWLSGDPVPETLQKCMDSWRRVMPDWEIRCWTRADFDVNTVPWVAQAVAHRKWAYAADYIRLYALYHQGGVYLDSDVLLLRSLEAFRHYDFFTSIEAHRDFYTDGVKELDSDGVPLDPSKPVTGLGLQAAVLGAKSGVEYVGKCMKWYENRDFVKPDGGFQLITMPGVLALQAVPYGFRYADREQELAGRMHIFDSSVFAGSGWDADKRRNYAIHYCEGSWRERTLADRVRKFIKRLVPRFIRRRL